MASAASRDLVIEGFTVLEGTPLEKCAFEKPTEGGIAA